MTLTVSPEMILTLLGFAATWGFLAWLISRLRKELIAARVVAANLQLRMAEMEAVVKPAEKIRASSSSPPRAARAGQTPDASDPA